MKKLLPLIFTVYLVLTLGMIFLAVTLTRPIEENWDDFAKTAAVGANLLTSLLTAAITLLVMVEQNRAARDLEYLKTNLAKDVEYVKRTLSEEAKAYAALNSAAITYYYVLANLEKGVFNTSSLETAEADMTRAASALDVIQKLHKDQWNDFWQRAHFIAEKANLIKGDPEALRALWADQVRMLGTLLQRFQASYNETMQNQASGAQKDRE